MFLDIINKMNKAYIFDVWQTLVDTPEWATMLEQDSELRALNEKAKDDVPSKRELVKRFDGAVQAGKLTIEEVEGARSVLETLASKGYPVAFSSGSNYTNQALLEGSGLRRYFNPVLITSDADTFKESKDNPEAYIRLAKTLEHLRLKPITFVDDTQKNIAAAAKSDAIPLIFHFDRALGLYTPQPTQIAGQAYSKISNLKQIPVHMM